jgi:hypothetical protein
MIIKSSNKFFGCIKKIYSVNAGSDVYGFALHQQQHGAKFTFQKCYFNTPLGDFETS